MLNYRQSIGFSVLGIVISSSSPVYFISVPIRLLAGLGTGGRTSAALGPYEELFAKEVSWLWEGFMEVFEVS